MDMGSELNKLVLLFNSCILIVHDCISITALYVVKQQYEKCRQNKSIDHLSDDVDELNSRMKGANQRTRRLLG